MVAWTIPSSTRPEFTSAALAPSRPGSLVIAAPGSSRRKQVASPSLIADQPPPNEPPASVTLVVGLPLHCHRKALSGRLKSRRRKWARSMGAIMTLLQCQK